QNVTTGSSGQPEVRVPGLVDVTVNAIGGSRSPTAVTVKRIPELDSGLRPLWQPKVIFDANWDGTTAASAPRPIFFRPAVVVNQLGGGAALAFGTGDRESLWNSNSQPGRSYLFMDDSDKTAALPP